MLLSRCKSVSESLLQDATEFGTKVKVRIVSNGKNNNREIRLRLRLREAGHLGPFAAYCPAKAIV